jgi:cation:H+ antiporter
VSLTAVVVDLSLVAVAVLALWVGAGRFVESAAVLARRVGLSELVIGLTVVSVGTSAPEAAVTLDATLRGSGTIALANVVGSNFFNLGLVLGLVAVVRSVAGSTALVRRDGLAVLGATVALLLVVRDGAVTQLEGALLFAAFVGYLLVVWAGERETAVAVPPARSASTTLPAPVWLVLGLALVVGGANLLVDSASDLALLVGASEWLVGETVVAIGTSAPELATSVAAARGGLGDIAAGNLVGSSIFNLLGVLGLAAALVPLPAGGEAEASLLWLTLLTAAAVALLATGRELTGPEGALLAALALAKWVTDLL